MLGVGQPGEAHGVLSLALGGKGALLTALNYSAVRSHQAVSMRPVLRYLKRRGRRDPSPVCQSVTIEPEQGKERRLYAPEYVEGVVCELRPTSFSTTGVKKRVVCRDVSKSGLSPSDPRTVG